MKKHETIGCCGIDCGLCPRFHTKGDSTCPGCGGLNFKDKHPSCGILTCCVIKNKLEVCSDCKEFPCKKFDKEKEGFDSFVTHRKVFQNLDFIKNHGIEQFIALQKKRIDILKECITNFDDGRSKSFFCVSCALLPLDKLQETYTYAKESEISKDIKVDNKRLRETLINVANKLNVNLKLNNKK